MDMEVYFPGNKKVHARYKGFVVETDQPTGAGGDGTAPGPFDLFLISIGTCAGFYVLSFLQERDLPTEGAGLVLRTERDRETKLITKISLEIKLPAGFPEKVSRRGDPGCRALHCQAAPRSSAGLRDLYNHGLSPRRWSGSWSR